jgi:hypothetical protein
MRSAIIFTILLIAARSNVLAQIFPEQITAPRATPPPVQLLEQLMTPVSNDDDSGCAVPDEVRQATALKSLGINAKSAQSARLLFEDLDHDGVAEALLTVDLDYADVLLVVMKRKGDKWYRLPAPSDLSCWCKYESSPLDSFVEVRSWDEFPKENEPSKFILVRGSSGGTGLYERGLQIFALRGFEVKDVFDTTEERRECPWPEGDCKLQHVEVTFEQDGEKPRALVAREFDRNINLEKLKDDSWSVGLPVSKCTAYTWSAPKFKFVKNTAATIAYCGRPSPGSTATHHGGTTK